jgi:hypothetical protein
MLPELAGNAVTARLSQPLVLRWSAPLRGSLRLEVAAHLGGASDGIDRKQFASLIHRLQVRQRRVEPVEAAQVEQTPGNQFPAQAGTRRIAVRHHHG